ncbi:MAG: hypothetical protein IJP88_07630, partial [Synergistaceae bacterium]|nr:hypothetical protein [Synergistaceae bacterium]
ADWEHTFVIEIKSNSDAEKKLSGNTRKYIALRNDPNVKGAVFYLGDISMVIDDIQYVSWKNWGEFM